MTKYIICLGDGMADHPIDSLGNKTPLEVAHIPHINELCQKGILGQADTVPPGFSPGSDVANMGILGYDPALYYTGRGPIEAASLGVTLADDEMVFRCNLVNVNDTIMHDFTADHISTEESHALIDELNQHFQSSEFRFIPGVSYRHILVTKDHFNELKTTAPHDITNKDISSYLPHGKNENELAQFIKEANQVLAKSSINKQRKKHSTANMIWPWSQGKIPSLPSFKTTYNLTGGIVTAVDLLKGLGKLIELETPNVKGATGFIDTNYEEKIKESFKILENHDFCYIHIEAPDETGHMGRPDLKIKAIEDFDKHVIGPIKNYIKSNPDTVMMVLPDHPTPCDIRTHTHEPIPFFIYHPQIKDKSNLTYTEKNSKKTSLYYKTPWSLLSDFLAISPLKK